MEHLIDQTIKLGAGEAKVLRVCDNVDGVEAQITKAGNHRKLGEVYIVRQADL